MTSPDTELRPHSINDSPLQTGLDKIALVEELEVEGIRAHSLLKDSGTPNASLLEEIDETIHRKAEMPRRTFAQKKAIFARRRSRANAQRLIRGYRQIFSL